MSFWEINKKILIVPAVLLVLGWVTVLTRCWIKKHVLHKFSADDYLIVVSVVSPLLKTTLGPFHREITDRLIQLCFTVLCVLFCHSAAFGLGKHIKDVPREHISICLRDVIAFEITHVVTTILIKLSIGIMLLRLTSPGSLQRWIIYLTVSLYTFVGIGLIFLLCFQCYPIEYYWDRTVQGTCQPSVYIGACAYVNTIVGGGTDFVLAMLPIWLVWDLKLGWRTKVSIAVLLGMGNL
ncbi:hypothetical protein B0J14DRAFT_609312 [Halenospora varia]|nr:hypothetical protein B0J14DRAFT_609312 [Halenospora varia]